MKTATIPSLRVDPKLRDAAEGVLKKREALSRFIEQSIREGIERRHAQREFIARGLQSREGARHSGKYVAAAAVVSRLEEMLSSAIAKRRTHPSFVNS